MNAPTPTWQTLLLDPRDPLVFGDGGRIQAVVPRSIHHLPPQATAAGLVRTRFGEGQGAFSPQTAHKLLKVKIRGPWLAEEKEDGPLGLWASAPADVAVHGDELVRAEFVACDDREGVNLPEGCPVTLRFLTPPAKVGDAKTRRLTFPFWPLDSVIEWGLGACPNSLDRRADILAIQEGSKPSKLPPIAAEHRIHVAIDPESGTALPEALFNSGGQRYAENFQVVIEVDDSAADLPALATQPAASTLRVLGGEGRLVRCQERPGPTFPPYETWRPKIAKRMNQLLSDKKELYLRLQLLTPGAFGDWRPPASPLLAKELAALCLPRFRAVSGWNLQARGPRKIRRLVPPGAIYLYGPYDDHAELLCACEQLWGSSLCGDLPGDPQSFLAPPAHDGYGLVLPLPSTLPFPSTSSPVEDS